MGTDRMFEHQRELEQMPAQLAAARARIAELEEQVRQLTMPEWKPEHDVIVVFAADGSRSTRPKPRCACGGVLDAHPDRDASICRDCGAVVTARMRWELERMRAQLAVANERTAELSAQFESSRAPEASAALIVDRLQDPDVDLVTVPCNLSWVTYRAVRASLARARKLGAPGVVIENHERYLERVRECLRAELDSGPPPA